MASEGIQCVAKCLLCIYLSAIYCILTLPQTWEFSHPLNLIQFPHVGKIVDKAQQMKLWEDELGAVMGDRRLPLNTT